MFVQISGKSEIAIFATICIELCTDFDQSFSEFGSNFAEYSEEKSMTRNPKNAEFLMDWILTNLLKYWQNFG